MKKAMRVFAVACLAVVTGVSAEAATFQFADIDRDPSRSFSVTASNIEVTVRGVNRYGLADVKTDEGYGLSIGQHYIDGTDLAVFSFDETVTLSSFGASFADRNDRFNVLGWNGYYFQRLQFGQFASDAWQTDFSLNDYAASFASQHFAVQVAGPHTEFKITNLVAHGISEVPLPASGMLLLAGLGALALGRRKS